MSERLQTLKYTLTVEGETEQWYFQWLRDQINSCPERTYNISVNAKVQQSPERFYKGTTRKVTPEVTHICDMESNEKVHVEKFQRILSEMKDAKSNKNIIYSLGYSNYTFELWMVLHKIDCNGPISHRTQYLRPINRAFEENFEDLSHFKQENNFKRCLSQLNLNDVKAAIKRAERITKNNEQDQAKVKLHYKGYTYFRDNPSLSVHEKVRKMLTECGVI